MYSHYEDMQVDQNNSYLYISNMRKATKKQEREKWMNQLYSIMIKRNQNTRIQICKYQKGFASWQKDNLRQHNQMQSDYLTKCKIKTEWAAAQPYRQTKEIYSVLDISIERQRSSLNRETKTGEINNKNRTKLDSVIHFSKKRESRQQLECRKYNMLNEMIQSEKNDVIIHKPTLLIRKRLQEQIEHEDKENRLCFAKLPKLVDCSTDLKSSFIRSINMACQINKEKLLNQLVELEKTHHYALRGIKKSQRRFILGAKKQFFM